MSTDNTTLNLISYGFLAAIITGRLVHHRYRGRLKADIPILSSSELLTAGGLTSLSKGQISGYAYNLLTNNTGRTMINVQLAAATGIHIVAYGDKSSLEVASFNSRWLEPAVLEGDFPDYFHLYCSPSAQIAVRQVFEPVTMAQFIDFCRAYDFELFDDALYVSQAQGDRDRHDTTTLVTDLTDFLQHSGDLFRRLAKNQ